MRNEIGILDDFRSRCYRIFDGHGMRSRGTNGIGHDHARDDKR
jgi:hypothetical protein